MQDEGHHHAAASAQVRAFGRLLKNEARGARQSGKGRRWPGKVRGKSMAKYGQIWPNIANMGQNWPMVNLSPRKIGKKTPGWCFFHLWWWQTTICFHAEVDTEKHQQSQTRKLTTKIQQLTTHQFYRLESPVLPEFPWFSHPFQAPPDASPPAPTSDPSAADALPPGSRRPARCRWGKNAPPGPPRRRMRYSWNFKTSSAMCHGYSNQLNYPLVNIQKAIENRHL